MANRKNAASVKKAASSGKKSRTGAFRNTAKGSKRTSGRSAKSTAKKRKKNGNDSRIRTEIIFLVVLAFSILLLLSSFGLAGVVGHALSACMFGVFGFPAYAFPVLLFIGYVFVLSNHENARAMQRFWGAFGLYIFVCAFFQLIMIGYDRHTAMKDLYLDSSYTRLGGGIAGGFFVQIFGYAFGTAGAFVLILIGLVVFAILMTQEPLLKIVRSRAEKNAARRRERRLADAEADYTEPEEDPDYAEPEGIPEEDGVPLRSVADAGKTGSTDFTERYRQESIFEEDHSARNEENSRQAVPEDASGSVSAFPKKKKKGRPETAVNPNEKEIPFWERTEIPGSRSSSKKSEISSGRSKADPGKKKPLAVLRETVSSDGNYEFPPLSILHKGRKGGNSSRSDMNATAAKLQRTLHDFGVEVRISNISCGPTVTRYELQPEHGVKVSRILSLQDDIKLSLAAADIRIEAPIPGKSAIGIEVPNKTPSSVALRELLETEEFQRSASRLTFAVGRDIGGRPVIADIAKMPHVLIAGATGSGKSVCINTLIVSILYKATPDEVKFIMIDPKMVELSVYNGIPHLFIPVVTDPRKAAGALQWAVNEMTDRYNKFAGLGVRNIEGYNEKISAMDESENGGVKPEKMFRLVIIVDELADLMMTAQKEVENSIVRLSQLARAAGIHLVIATQRPSVNVITGLIKANMPSRIALAVTSGVDSRTILDMNGAEKLLGRGDMLFFPQNLQKPERVQGAFVTDDEIAQLVQFLAEHNQSSGYDQEAEKKIEETTPDAENTAADPGADRDAYFADAGKLIIEKDKASIGMLQRAFKIGFNRAARIMDQLCEAGVVGEEEGTKPRKIRMTMEEFNQMLEEQ